MAPRSATTRAKAARAAEAERRRQTNLGASLAEADADATKEPAITAGTTSQYWRGDKSWQALTSLPISTATQTALDAKSSIVTLQTIATDADATVTATTSRYQVIHTGTLTAGRALTLATVGVSSGWTMRFTRPGAGAFNLSIGGLKNLTTNTWCDVVYNGSAWVLTASGAL